MIFRFTIGASGQPGSRTPITWLQARCRSVGPAAQKTARNAERSARELNPVRLLTMEVCRRNTCGPERSESSRMELNHRLPDVDRASWPLDYGTEPESCGY